MDSQDKLNLAKETKLEIFFLPLPVTEKRKNKSWGEKRMHMQVWSL